MRTVLLFSKVFSSYLGLPVLRSSVGQGICFHIRLEKRIKLYGFLTAAPMARTFTLPVLSKMVFSDTATSLSSSIITMFMSRPPFSQVLFRHRQKKMWNPLLPDVMFMFPFKEAARSRILASPMPLSSIFFGTASVVCDTKLIKSRVFTNDYFYAVTVAVLCSIGKCFFYNANKAKLHIS